MAEEYSAGTVFLQVVPSYRGLQESIRRKIGDIDKDLDKQMSRDAEQTGRKAGRLLGEGLESGVSGDRVSKGVKRDLDKADSYVRNFRKRIDKALGAIGDGADFSSIESRLRALRDVEIDVELNSARAEAELAAIAAEARAIGALSPSIRVETNAREAATALMGVAVAARAASAAGDSGGRSGGSWLSKMSGDGQDAANSFRLFNGVILATSTLGAGLIPIIGALSGAIAALGLAGSGAAGGLGVMLLGFSGIGDAVSELGTAQDSVDSLGKKTSQASGEIRTALQAINDAERQLARTRRDAAEANQDAARASRDAVEDAADANRDAAQQTRDAVRATKDAVREGAQAQRDASQQTRDAVRDSARANEEASRRIQDAQRQAADAVQDALRRQEQAERDYASAQRDSAAAQRDLIAAREEGRQQLDDIRDQQRQNALDERQAVIDLFNAHTEAIAARQDPGATNLEREQAEINLGNARERLHEIREEETRLAGERKKGLKGTDAVRSAQDALTSALEAQQAAHRAVGDAAREVDRARVEGARAVQQAVAEATRVELDGRRAVNAARRNEATIARESARAIAEARQAEAEARRNEVEVARDGLESIAEAERNQARTARDGRQSVRDAQRNLTRAQRDYREALRQTGAAGVGAMEGVQSAMSKLSPAGRRFARFLHSLRDDFYRLRYAAQEGMLPGVQSAMQMVISKYGPAFTRYVRKMAETVGGLFELLGRRLTKSGGPFQGFFRMLDRTGPRLLREFGRGLIMWGEIFASVFTTLEPYALRISRMLLRATRAVLRFVESPRGKNGIREFMDWAFRILPKVGKFFGALARAAGNLFKALAPVGEAVLGMVTGFLNWIASMDPKQLRVYALLILGIVGAIQLASAALSVLAVFSGPGAIIAGVIAGLAVVGVAFYKLYQDSESFRDGVKAVFNALKTVVKAWWNLVLKPIFAEVTKVWRQLARWFDQHWESHIRPMLRAFGRVVGWLWRNVLRPTFRFIGQAFVTMIRVQVWAWKNILWPALKAIARVVGWLWRNVLKPIFRFISAAWNAMVSVIRWWWRNVLRPVWNAIANAIEFLWKVGIKPRLELIKLGWRVLVGVIKLLWRTVWKPIWDAIKVAAGILWRNVLKPIFDAIKRGWGILGDRIREVWRNYIKPAWEALKDGIRAVRDSFENAIKGIRTWWNKLINIAKGPVRFVVNTVINKGLIGSFNKIAEWLDIDSIKPIDLPKGFARGGIPSARDMSVYPGYTPGRDVGYIGISGGEGILRPEATRAVGAPVINAINSAAISGGVEGVKRYLGGYWKGGVLPTRMERINRHGAPNSYYGATAWDINGPGQDKGQKVRAFKRGRVADVNHWDHSYGNHVIIKHPQSRQETLYAHLKSTRVRAGQQVYAGQMIGKLGETGHAFGPHLHFELDGGIRGPRERAGRGRGDATEHDPVDMYRLRRDARGYNGVKPHVAAVGDLAARLFGPFPGGIGGVGARSGPSDHPSGHALDFMTKRKSQGDALSDWLAKESKQLAVKYIIWRQRIKNPPKSPWDRMENRGDPTSNHMDHVHASFLKNAHPSFGRGVISGPGGGGGGGGLFSNLPAWLQAFARNAAGWFSGKISPMMSTLSDNFGGGSDSPHLAAVKAVPGKIIDVMADYLMSKLPRGTRGGAASNFGPGPEGIFKSLMSTGYYTKRQAAGVLGNMHIESGFVPDIVQGGGHKRTPAGVGSGWGLVQWTPGSKIMPYLRRIGDYGVAGQVTALTQQLRGKGRLGEALAGSKLKQAKTPEKAAWAFGKYYERPASLSSTIGERRRVARALYEKYRDLNLGETNPQRPTRDRNRGNFANGGIVPGGNIYLRDKGGLLPPGISTVLNATGGHEKMAVFNDEQWRTLKSMGERGGSGITYAPTFEASDLTAGDVADDLLFTLRRVELGGVYTGADS